MELKPIEKLYLISKERQGLMTKRNKLYCLIYSLMDNKNISSNKVNSNGINMNRIYEDNLIKAIKDKDFIQVNNLVEDLNIFNQSLVNAEVLKLEVKSKKVLFLNLAKNEITKTALYYKLQSQYEEEFSKGFNVLDIVCEKREYKDKINNYYNQLKKRMIEAVAKADKEKPQIDMSGLFNMGGKDEKK